VVDPGDQHQHSPPRVISDPNPPNACRDRWCGRRQEEYSNFIVTAVASIAAPHALKIMRSLSLSPAGDEVVVAADGSVAIVNIGAQVGAVVPECVGVRGDLD
jgi:hypothetical protein